MWKKEEQKRQSASFWPTFTPSRKFRQIMTIFRCWDADAILKLQLNLRSQTTFSIHLDLSLVVVERSKTCSISSHWNRFSCNFLFSSVAVVVSMYVFLRLLLHIKIDVFSALSIYQRLEISPQYKEDTFILDLNTLSLFGEDEKLWIFTKNWSNLHEVAIFQSAVARPTTVKQPRRSERLSTLSPPYLSYLAAGTGRTRPFGQKRPTKADHVHAFIHTRRSMIVRPENWRNNWFAKGQIVKFRNRVKNLQIITNK